MTYQVREGPRTIPLNRDEAMILIRGEIPPVLAPTLAARGLVFPRRGARPITLLIQHGETVRENTCYARIARTTPAERRMAA